MKEAMQFEHIETLVKWCIRGVLLALCITFGMCQIPEVVAFFADPCNACLQKLPDCGGRGGRVDSAECKQRLDSLKNCESFCD